MKLIRPHIPIKIRCKVIARQLLACHSLGAVLAASSILRNKDRLAYMLKTMFDGEKVHLDHDPPLCLREIIDAEKGIYKPDANDPEFLVYRTAEEHRLKTFVRGDGAQLSDAGKRRKEIRRNRPKRPSRWPPKGSRPLGRSRRESTDRRPDSD